MIAIITKIISVFTSIVMMFLSFIGIVPQPSDHYARLETPEYFLGECVSDDIEAIVNLYNTALIKTRVDGEEPEGEQMIKLISGIEGDGALEPVLKVATPVIDSAVERNNFKTDHIPGNGRIRSEDVEKAYSYVTEDGRVFVTIFLKEQTDGADGNHTDGGAVSRGIGTLGSVDHALDQLGAKITEGRETVKLEYTNAYINCELDPETGKILLGTWHYDVDVCVYDARIIIGAIAVNIKNLRGKLEYAVVLGDYKE